MVMLKVQKKGDLIQNIGAFFPLVREVDAIDVESERVWLVVREGKRDWIPFESDLWEQWELVTPLQVEILKIKKEIHGT